MPKEFTIDTIHKEFGPFMAKYGASEKFINDAYEKFVISGEMNIYRFFSMVFFGMTERMKEESPTMAQIYGGHATITAKWIKYLRTYIGDRASEEHYMLICYMVEHDLALNKIERDKAVIIHKSPGCCPYCDDYDGSKFTVQELENDQVYDIKKCTRDTGCVCQFEVEKNG